MDTLFRWIHISDIHMGHGDVAYGWDQRLVLDELKRDIARQLKAQPEPPVDAILGLTEGDGFAQMMKGLETGRLQVAARALGVGRAALEDSLAVFRICSAARLNCPASACCMA